MSQRQKAEDAERCAFYTVCNEVTKIHSIPPGKHYNLSGEQGSGKQT